LNRSVNFFVILFTIMIFSLQACAKDSSLKTDKQKVSYSIGQQIGQNMKAQGLDIDVDALSMSLSDALEGRESRLSEEEMRSAMQSMQEEMRKKQMEATSQNKGIGEGYLAENKKKKGVQVTASGIQYEILTKGNGKSPKKTDRVKVHYKGTLIDGTEFDSSYKRNQPAEFSVSGVIAGWTEALQLMKVGAKWRLHIPSHLAYGERGRPSIPPNSVLIFEVELLEIL